MTAEEQQSLSEEYAKILSFYREVKELVATCEKIDPEQRAPISAVAELRSVLDHVARAHKVVFGLVSEESIQNEKKMSAHDYCKKNFGKALGHLYRAGYDAYDIIALFLIEEIDGMLKGVSRRALFHVIPEFGSFLDGIDAGKKRLTAAKVDKDVEDADSERLQFEKCEQGNSQLADARDLLRSRMEHVYAYEAELAESNQIAEKRHRRISGRHLWISILVCVVVAAASYCLGIFHNPSPLPGQVKDPPANRQQQPSEHK